MAERNAQVKPGFLPDALPDKPSNEGEDFQVAADDCHEHIVPGLTHWAHPSFFAYFSAPANFESILGDLYSTAFQGIGFNMSVHR
jgi:aromatic-L-amino-acid decarboxylase